MRKGTGWDSETIRTAREEGWFAENEAKLIEEARARRKADEKKRLSAEQEARRLAHWHKCPKCGADMAVQKVSDIEVEKCTSCEGVFFDRGELDELLLSRDKQRRGFFRKLLGFEE
jgi:hypothetical protein